jgi:hypothetical protein
MKQQHSILMIEDNANDEMLVRIALERQSLGI